MKMLVMKAKTSVKLKPIVSRKEEKKPIKSTVKKIPPVLGVNDQQAKSNVSNSAEYQRLIRGDFTQDFSKQSSRLFRIFLSSTFSDFKVERNELYRRVFPVIKQRCAQLGYEFQVVDMRWGVSDTADSDHTADIICMDEIERSIDLSAGLNFIYLVGNRYGSLYVPLEIPESEFESILEVVRERDAADLNLIKKWFQLDRNSSPPMYVYLPITTHFKHFEDQSPEQQEEKQQWRNEEKSLLTILRESVDKAFERKKLSQQQATKYFQSITEREIRRATVDSNRSNVIGIIRDFVNPFVEAPLDAKFIDKNERITNAINQLKVHCVKVTPSTQFRKFLVPWTSGGLNMKDQPSHRDYIDEFCQFLTSTILQSVEKTCQKISNQILSTFREDLLHQAIFCREKTKFFFGREDLLANIHSRIELNRRNVGTPLALIAESGCGKTSVMARLAQELRQWYPDSAVFIRFLGTSARTTNIELVIRSLCRQLKLVYGMETDDDEDEDDSSITFSSLIRIFHERLKAVSKKTSQNLQKKGRPKPLFILLDAIDQLEDASKQSFQFDSWLLRYLPRDVHIFLSFIPTVERVNFRDIFLQFIRNDESTLFIVPRLRPKDSEDIIRSSLQAYHRQLTSEQYTCLLSTVEQNPKPLYLKLLIDIARRWTCFSEKSSEISLILPETIEDAVDQLFARLENRYGKEFVQYSLAYLIYGLNGISENELEDCLSINDIVLNEIYTHHDPPIPNAIHVPSLLCQSFLYSIKEYLSRKRIHDKHILSFYHRKFIESTRKRYAHLREQCHEHLIEIYSNDQPAYKRTILLKKRNNKTILDADRLINSQMTNELNQRKLIALPYHCLEYGPGKDHLLRSICLFNLPFLACQLKSLGQTIFLDFIRSCLRSRPQWTDLKRLYRAAWAIDDELIEERDVFLILAEQILGYIDNQKISQLYKSSSANPDLEKLLDDCRTYCIEHANSFRSLYAGFPQESAALAWSFSPVTHILYMNEFYALVILDGYADSEEERLIETWTVAVINLSNGKVEKIYLDETFDRIWDGYVTKNGNKVFLLGIKFIRTYNTRTGDMLDERTLSWDNKSFCNKAFCITSNEEYLMTANESRIIALSTVDTDLNYRTGRIPSRNPLFQVENRLNVDVSLRCIGANDDYILCLIFDENDHLLLSLWSLNEHEELLLMRFVFISHETTSTDLFDLFENNNETLYLATDDGVLRIINLLKVKTNTKVQNLSTDETIEQLALIPEGGVERLVCFSDDLLGLSTSEYLLLIDRKFPSKIFQKIPFQQTLYYWTLINQEDHQRILITVNSTQKFITISRQGTDPSAKFSPINIEFRSTVSDIKLIQTTTLIDNDDKKKTYVLILLDDLTVQLLDTNQLSQASLQPVGLFTRIRNYNISEKVLTACEYDSPCPLAISPWNAECSTPQYLHQFDGKNITHIALLENDQYHVVIADARLMNIYSTQDWNQSLFQYDLSDISSMNLFSFRTYPSNVMIFMFKNQFVCWKMDLNRVENRFEVLSKQIISIPVREKDYSIEFTPNQRFLILQQSLNLESNPDLCDLRVYTCDNLFKLTPIKESIAFAKSKLISGGKITAFLTYTSCYTRPELFVAYQGFILRVRLPSTTAELDIISNHHSWMRHSLTMYNQTTDKSDLSITVTSLAIQPSNDSILVSGGDDGTIVLWYLTTPGFKDVLESLHNEQITDLKFDPNSDRMYSSSLDRIIAIWLGKQLHHIVRVHIPIDRMNLLCSSNILLARGQFWGFDRLILFHIQKNPQELKSQEKNNPNKDSQKTTNIQASEIASWAL